VADDAIRCDACPCPVLHQPEHRIMRPYGQSRRQTGARYAHCLDRALERGDSVVPFLSARRSGRTLITRAAAVTAKPSSRDRRGTTYPTTSRALHHLVASEGVDMVTVVPRDFQHCGVR